MVGHRRRRWPTIKPTWRRSRSACCDCASGWWYGSVYGDSAGDGVAATALYLQTWWTGLVSDAGSAYPITFIQCWTNVKDVGPTLYKYYTMFFCLLGCRQPVSRGAWCPRVCLLDLPTCLWRVYRLLALIASLSYSDLSCLHPPPILSFSFHFRLIVW